MTTILDQEPFPDAPLTDSQERVIYDLCGGDEPELAKMKDFLRGPGQEAIPDEWFRTYLQNVGLRWLDALGIDVSNPSARTNLNRGLLFYSGTVRVIGADKQLPHTGAALAEIKDADPQDTSIGAMQAVQDLTGFHGLFERYRKDFEPVSGYDGFVLALVGAGLAHIVRAESKRTASIPLEEKHADMSEAERERGILANIEMKDFNGPKHPRTDKKLPLLPSIALNETRKPLGDPYLGEHDRRIIKGIEAEN